MPRMTLRRSSPTRPLRLATLAAAAGLLFALQAAIGAGFIGYYLGVSVTRERMRRELRDGERPAGEQTAEKLSC